MASQPQQQKKKVVKPQTQQKKKAVKPQVQQGRKIRLDPNAAGQLIFADGAVVPVIPREGESVEAARDRLRKKHASRGGVNWRSKATIQDLNRKHGHSS